jgi:hypothetical protein
MDGKPGTGEEFTVRILQLATGNILTASSAAGKSGREKARGNDRSQSIVDVFFRRRNFVFPRRLNKYIGSRGE